MQCTTFRHACFIIVCPLIQNLQDWRSIDYTPHPLDHMMHQHDTCFSFCKISSIHRHDASTKTKVIKTSSLMDNSFLVLLVIQNNFIGLLLGRFLQSNKQNRNKRFCCCSVGSAIIFVFNSCQQKQIVLSHPAKRKWFTSRKHSILETCNCPKNTINDRSIVDCLLTVQNLNGWWWWLVGFYTESGIRNVFVSVLSSWTQFCRRWVIGLGSTKLNM